MRIRTICAGIALVVAALLAPSTIQAMLRLTDCIGGGLGNGIVECGDPGAPLAKGANLLQQAPGSPVPLSQAEFLVGLTDANGDGSLDLVTVVRGFPNNFIEFRPGDGHGGFGAPIQSTLSTEAPISFARIGDVNLDGRPDVVTLVRTIFGQQIIEAWLGDGNGQFSYASGMPVSLAGEHGMAIADVTGDNTPDIVTISQHGGVIDVWSGNGSGSFAFHANSPGTQFFTPGGIQINSAALALADVNGDGKLDVLTNGPGAVVRYGDGLGSFAPAAPVGTPDTFYQGIGSSLAGADLNGDGRVDIVYYDGLQFRVTLNSPGGPGPDTSIYQAVPSLSDTFSTSMAIADVDGDGALDLLGMIQAETAEVGSIPEVSVLFGDGAGGFSNPSFYPVGNNNGTQLVGALLAGDLNGDGRPDVVTSETAFGTNTTQLEVLLHVSGVGLDQLSSAIAALNLPAGTANALQAKVKAAGASRERGNAKATANQLNALINQIDALRQSGRLTAAQAASLITTTQQVIAGL